MRDFRKAKPQTARRQRIESYYNCLSNIGGSRGRRGAQGASIGAALPHARVWSGLGSARSRLARRFGGRVFRRCCGPALGGRWRGRLASARGHWLAAARARAIVVGRLAACAWRATQVGSGELCALTGRFPGACEWWLAECKPRGRGVAVCGWSASSHAR